MKRVKEKKERKKVYGFFKWKLGFLKAFKEEALSKDGGIHEPINKMPKGISLQFRET